MIAGIARLTNHKTNEAERIPTLLSGAINAIKYKETAPLIPNSAIAIVGIIVITRYVIEIIIIPVEYGILTPKILNSMKNCKVNTKYLPKLYNNE